MTTSSLGLLSIFAGTLLALPAAGQDWPQWRGPNRDDKASGFAAPDKWPAELNKKWSEPVGTGDATPALVGERLYVFACLGEEDVLQCRNAADGKEIWTAKSPSVKVPRPADSHPGPRSSPVVADGKVVALGVGGSLFCVDASTGKELWRKDDYPKVVPRFYTAMSPLVVDGLAVAQLGGAGNGAVLAYDLATGAEKWKWDKEGPDYGSPVLLTVAGVKQVVAMTEKSMVGLAAADGRLLWQVPFVPQRMAYNAITPVVDGETVIVSGGGGRGTKAFKIQKEGEGFKAVEVWANAQIGTQFNSPVLKDGRLYGATGQGNYFCLDAKTGQTLWTDTSKKVGQYAAMVDAGSAIVSLPENGELTVFKPGDKEYTEVARIKVSGAKTYAHPLLSGKRIYIKDQNTLTLYTLD